MFTFLLEHKIFKAPFIFRTFDYTDLCSKQLEDLLKFVQEHDITYGATPTPNEAAMTPNEVT